MKTRTKGVRLKTEDVELYRFRQAQTGISTLWGWRGPAKKCPSTAAERLVPEDFFRRNPTYHFH
jgi:hypothetical protein